MQILNGKNIIYTLKCACIIFSWIYKFTLDNFVKLYFRRIDEYGKELTTQPGKLYLKKSKSIAKLVIKNLELSDSMVYILAAENGAHKKQISLTLSVKGI